MIGWNQSGEARARTSRIPNFSARVKATRKASQPDFSAAELLASFRAFAAKLGPILSDELSMLASERDPEMFYSGFLNLGLRLESHGKIELAVEVYSAIAGELGAPLDVSQQAQKYLHAILGRGSAGLRAELLLRQFANQATDPAAIFAMGAAGVTFKWVRLGTLGRLLASPPRTFVTSGLGARAAAGLAGFAAEVPVFTLGAKFGNEALGRKQAWDSDSLAHELLSSTLLLGSLKVFGTTASAFARPPLLRGVALKLIPQGALLGGILLGHRLEEAAGLREPLDGATTLTDSLVTLLHFNIGGHLANRAFKMPLSHLDNYPEPTRPVRPSSFLPIATVPTHNVPQLQWRPTFSNDFHLSKMGSNQESGGLGSKRQELLLQFRHRFPPNGREIFSEKILQAALRIPFKTPHFHERLLEALLESPDRGNRQQLFSIRAIEEVFNANALNSSTGSFDYLLIQKFIQEALGDPILPRGTESIREIVKLFREGLTRQSLSSLFTQRGYGGDLTAPAVGLATSFRERLPTFKAIPGWKDYRPADRALLSQFAHEEGEGSNSAKQSLLDIFADGRNSGNYLKSDIDAAMDHARRHPQGRLVLRRLLHIFAVKDVPGKVRELFLQSREADTLQVLSKLKALGMSPESMAVAINGTQHTGHLTHMALARKVVSIMLEGARYFYDPSIRETAKRRLDGGVLEFLNSDRSFGPEDILNLLATNPSPMVRLLVEKITAGEVVIEVVSAHRLQLETQNLSLISDCTAVFVQAGLKRPGRLLVKELPDVESENWEAKLKSYAAIVHRLASTIHEFEHWRHGNGRFSGMEQRSQALNLVNPEREERLASEVMADLEEELWRLAHLDADTWEIARQLGQPLALFLRDFNDEGNFRRENEARLAEFTLPKP